ncbi:MAG: tRNA (N6-threonylcarbamoyladenosine(37)-N6)-methyltransferase TrmO [Paludibacteraceae bacterium]|nr:tRNA (N6-threonylcarbamoyladenosine(37)-N6)-methyltransferase TrmO [Paludibacteraceae bacterium]
MMELKVIAYARNGFSDKFGIPRQSREESSIVTRIVFTPDYSSPDAIRGISDYSHLWLLWGFSANRRFRHAESEPEQMSDSLTVRPPRLGGNTRVGVFATRSPFRPNPIGLTSVRLLRVESGELIVSGADLLDGTPIYDIKPYLSFSDSHPDACNGFAEKSRDYRLHVDWSSCVYAESDSVRKEALRRDLEEILSQDPRPAYQTDSERIYRLDYAGHTVAFKVQGDTVVVESLNPKD